MSPRKGYCFTLNNYTDEEYESITRTCESEGLYAILGKEVGESGTPHLQGYIMFKQSYRFNTIKQRFLPRCHIELAAGTPEQNRRYCSKDGDVREFGSIPKSGNPTRDDVARRFAERMDHGGHGLSEFAVEHPGCYYFSGHNLVRNYLALKKPKERPDVQTSWIYGAPGTGKSRAAHELYPEAYIKDPRTKWWSGYMCESEVIIDDFGPGGIDINHLLRWFDRYKCLVETKGGMIPLYADKFVITSNFHPSEIFTSSNFTFKNNVSYLVDGTHPQLPALMRRLTISKFE